MSNKFLKYGSIVLCATTISSVSFSASSYAESEGFIPPAEDFEGSFTPNNEKMKWPDGIKWTEGIPYKNEIESLRDKSVFMSVIVPLEGDILVDSDTEHDKIYEINAGDKINFTGALNVTNIKTILNQIGQTDANLENVQSSFITNIKLPDVVEIPKNISLNNVKFEGSKGIFNVSKIEVKNNNTISVTFDLIEGISKFSELKEKVNSVDDILKITINGLSIKNSAKSGEYTAIGNVGGYMSSTFKDNLAMGFYSVYYTEQSKDGLDFTKNGSEDPLPITFTFKVNSSSNSGTYIPGQDPDRIDGVDRVETAVNVSKETYPNGANAVILANKNKFSDVLTAVPLSVQIGAPILFTNTDTLPQDTKDEIARLNPSTIYINGGTESVAKAIETNLSNSGKSVTRFNGVDRYHTAKLIAEKIREKGDKRVVEIASGETFPDALSISSLAVKENAPILLSKKNDLTKYTKSALATWDVDKATIAGQTQTISNTVQGLVTSGFNIGDTKNPDNVFRGAKDTRRLGGADRYETSTKIAEYTLPDATFGVYASGQVFADSLIAGPYAAVNTAPVLLVKRDAMPNSVQDYTKKSKINKAKLIGGENTVNNNVLNLLKSLVANKK